MIRRLLVAAYLVEAGVLLILVPWTAFWQRNYFAAVVPGLGWAMADPFVRGAISGVGLITALAGLRDIFDVLFVRRTP